MLNGIKVKIGDVVKFTMFTNWTFKQNSEHVITGVSEMDEDGWFDIKLDSTNDWHCCLHFDLAWHD